MEYLVNLATVMAHERLDDARAQAALSCCTLASAPATTCIESDRPLSWLRQSRCVAVPASSFVG